MPDPCVQDSPRIALTLTGVPHALTADVILSLLSQNGLLLEPDGLYAPGRPVEVLAMPTGPTDGDEIYYMADVANGVVWHLRYNAGSASTYKWEFVGGSEMYVKVLTSETRPAGGSAYAALATPVEIQLPVDIQGDFEISHGAFIGAGTDGQGANQTVKLGAVAAGNNESCANGNTRTAAVMTSLRALGLPPGTLLALRYANADAANPANFSSRWMRIRPIRVG